ncbi:MAG: hypothetical protein VXX55_00815, partial [Planctomycetota bacterium]|nr:hypothetical protein [Planctomycetota bacterium]
MTSFRLLLSLGLALTTSVGISTLQAKPLKVFILVGQSNMQGHAQIKTMEVMALDPATAPLLNDL